MYNNTTVVLYCCRVPPEPGSKISFPCSLASAQAQPVSNNNLFAHAMLRPFQHFASDNGSNSAVYTTDTIHNIALMTPGKLFVVPCLVLLCDTR